MSVSPDNTVFTGNTDPLLAVRTFVERETATQNLRERTSDIAAEVAGPIQVLRMKQDGKIEWIARPNVCQNQQ